jgi:hypothetical protein
VILFQGKSWASLSDVQDIIYAYVTRFPASPLSPLGGSRICSPRLALRTHHGLAAPGAKPVPPEPLVRMANTQSCAALGGCPCLTKNPGPWKPPQQYRPPDRPPNVPFVRIRLSAVIWSDRLEPLVRHIALPAACASC